MLALRRSSLVLGSVLLAACLDKPPGLPAPEREPPPPPPPTAPSPASAAEDRPPPPPPVEDVVVDSPDGSDPTGGKFTLDDATAGLEGSGPLTATITTSLGVLRCKLFDDKAPVTVASFVGLARGTRPFRISDDRWVKRPFYDGTTFHRVIKGFMIQGGDPLGNGTGGPGYELPDEIWPGSRHDRAGLLCMANRGKNTNGSQFFITDAATRQLDGNYTIFGECSPASVVHEIARVPKGPDDRPFDPVRIDRVEITR
ncbi:MAG: peptidylprolyl isomerase [Labilithrix sp.]|nr:peptidylprolyl isomerase [Labilithrix sp.]